jgi:hypothetical protein
MRDVSAVLAADGDRAWFGSSFDVRASCDSDASGHGPCYMDPGFNNLVLGHTAKTSSRASRASREQGVGCGKDSWQPAAAVELSGPWGPRPMTADRRR